MDYVPQQELYDQLYIESERLGYTTYDHLPMQTENAEYPFVVLGSNQMITANLKTAIGGQFHQVIDVWGAEEMRFQVTTMLDRLNRLGQGYLMTDHFRFVGRINQNESQIIQDTSVPNTVLNHGILTLVFSLQ